MTATAANALDHFFETPIDALGPQLHPQNWDVTAADVQWTDALYPLAQQAMQRGYYMPNRNSTRCNRQQASVLGLLLHVVLKEC